MMERFQEQLFQTDLNITMNTQLNEMNMYKCGASSLVELKHSTE